MPLPSTPGAGSRRRLPRIPKSSRGSPAVLAGILLVLLPSAFLTGRFGVENLSRALTCTGRITGAVLIASSAITVVAAQPWLSPGDWIEPGDEFVTRTIVQLPMDTPYDRLAFYATGSFARKDKLGLTHVPSRGNTWSGGKVPAWMSHKGLDSVIHRGRVRENNAIDERTRDPHFVTVYRTFGPHGAEVSETVTRRGEENRTMSEAESHELVNRYGIVRTRMGPFERSLWDIKTDIRAQ